MGLGGARGGGSNLSVFSITLSSPKPLDEIQQFLFVSYLYEWGMQRHIFGPVPGSLGRDKKVKYRLFQLQSQFQRFLNQTLYVFLHIKN